MFEGISPFILARTWMIRAYHASLCSVILLGVLFSKTVAQHLFVLLSLVTILILMDIYDGCSLSVYEKQDGFPSLTEIMKMACLKDIDCLPLNTFERLIPIMFIFIILFRMTTIVIVPHNLLF